MFESVASAAQTFIALMSCMPEYNCALVPSADIGFPGAVFLLFGLLAGGVHVSSAGMALLLDSPPRRVVIVIYAFMAFIWLWLCFGYAMPQAAANANYLIWVVQVALLTAFLALGILVMAGYFLFLWHNVRSPGLMMPLRWWNRLIMMAMLVGVIVGWRYLLELYPSLQEGPFRSGPNWYVQSMTVWSLGWPTAALWWFVSFLATDTGLMFFSVASLAAVILPVHSTGGAGKLAAGLASHMSSAVVAIVVSLIVGLLLFAAGVLALLALMFYFLYLTMFAVLVGAIIAWVVKE